MWRVVTAGYPYHSAEELGVDDWTYAYQATKTAIYCVLEQTNEANYYGIDSTGEKTADLIRRLVYEGENGTRTYKDSVATITKYGDMILEGNFYIQNYTVSANVEIESYNVVTTDFPQGSVVTNTSGVVTKQFSNGERFQIRIPKTSIINDVNGKIRVDVNTKSYPIFFGQTYDTKLQNYAITADPISLASSVTTLSMKGNTAGLKIIKTDEETGVSLEGVVFNVRYEDGTNIGNFTTDKNGIITINNLRQGKIIVTEVSTTNEYILDTTPHTVELEYNQLKTIELTNKHKKGILKIIKVDADDNNLTLGAVEFDLIDSNGNVVSHLITDINGIAEIEVNTGNYILRETLTKKEYNLAVDQDVIIDWNKTMEIKVENEKKKGQIEVYKTDAEDNKIKLEGVEFQVINVNGEVVETIVTNSEGYAITSRIPIQKYFLKEIKTDEMHVLNEEIIEVDVTTDIISRLEIKNERIKGQIKIVKTSENDNFINGEKLGSPIENVKFEIYDSNNNIVDEIITSEDGTATTKLLDKGRYYIKEVESGEWYLLNENTFEVEIKEHQEIVEIEITNESEKPNVDIEKTGIIQTTANQEIKYDFAIKNTGNVPLSDFTWYDYLPTDYVRITRLITGTYNQDLNYAIYYKTNKSDYRLLKDNLNTQVNNYIDFSNLELEADEYVTEFKVDFGTVDVGFESVINPYIFVRVKDTVKNDDVFTNKTRIEGYNKTYMVWDEDEHTTEIYKKRIKVKKLPRTGF